MDIPKILSLNAQTLILGNRSLDSSTEQVNIISSNGTQVKINGVVPGGGGGGGQLPITGTGDILITGNITANGDGISNGKIEGQTIKSIDNIVISAGSLEVVTGGVDIKGNGNLALQGNGNINQLGFGKITSGSGGIESKGDIKTIGAFDLEIGKDIYFDGTDIYHRTINPVAQKSYKDYKQLVGLNDNNIFTGANQFNSNTTEFAAKVSVGTRDPLSLLFTQNLALNTSGNIESKTINNATTIQCGNINCGNGGENSVAARVFKTRTNEHPLPLGWTIEQENPSSPVAGPLDNILQLKAGAVGGVVTITDSAFSGSVANIELDPRTTINGGKITTTQYNVGAGTTGYLITQPKVGPNIENLLIMAGSGTNPKVVFDDYGSTTTLMTLEKEVGNNDGLLRIPHIEFGIVGPRNRIYNLQSGATNLNLNIQHASASSEIVFQDNAQAEIMRVLKTQVILGEDIPIKFDQYSFRPIEITYAFTGATLDANPPVLFNSATTNFTRTNDGVVVKLNDLGEAVYILSIDATSSSGGTIGSSRFMCNFPYMVSANASGSFSFSGNFCINTTPPAGFAEPTIEGDGTGGPVGSTDYAFAFSSITGTETYNGVVKITRLSY